MANQLMKLELKKSNQNNFQTVLEMPENIDKYHEIKYICSYSGEVLLKHDVMGRNHKEKIHCIKI